MAIIHGLWTEPDGWRSTARTGRCVTRCSRTRPHAAGGATRTIILGGKGGPRLAGWSPDTATSST